jgi:hypothetical protein
MVSKQQGGNGPPTRAKNTTSPTQTSKSDVLSRLTSAWDVTDKVKMLLYGKSGTGKTTLWSSFPGPILTLICSGGKQPGELKSIDTPELRKKVRAVVIQSTDNVREILDSGVVNDFATVVLDHASGLQDLTLKEILGLDELPAQKSWGMASQQQYGQSSLMCKELFRALLGVNAHLVIVAQERQFGEGENSDLIAPTIGAALTPSVTGWLNPSCDYVVQTFLRQRTEKVETKIGGDKGKVVTTERRLPGVEYLLRVGPHETYMTKFRTPKSSPVPEYIADPTFAKIQKIIKGG